MGLTPTSLIRKVRTFIRPLNFLLPSINNLILYIPHPCPIFFSFTFQYFILFIIRVYQIILPPLCAGIVPLFLAARGGHLELVRGLLKNGADVNFQGGQQHIAPLHWAAHKEREDVALLLISRGADILLNDRENRTPLSMAAPTLASRMMSEFSVSFFHLWLVGYSPLLGSISYHILVQQPRTICGSYVQNVDLPKD